MKIGRIFLVGCPRSGTTLLQSLLAAHPQSTSFPETHFFVDLVPTQSWLRRLGLASGRTRGRFERVWLEMGSMDGSIAPPVLPLMSLWARAFLRILDEAACARGKTWWVEKTPGHVQYIPEITRYVRGAKFIHLIRSGEDVVASLYEVTREYPKVWGGPWSVDRCIQRWITDVQASLTYRGAPGHVIVDYDQLTTDPKATLQLLCRFIGVPFVEGMLTEYARRAESIVLPSEPWKSGARELIRKRGEEKFKTLFTTDQQQYIVSRISHLDLAQRAAVPRIALITPEPHHPPSSGGQLRVAQHLHVLRRIGFDVNVLAFTTGGGGELPPGIEKTQLFELKQEGRLGKLWRFFVSSVLTQHPHWRRIAPSKSQVAQTLRAWWPDAVILEYSLLGALVPLVHATLPGVPVIVDAHNAEHKFLRELLTASKTLRMALRHWLELRGLERIETRDLPQADEVWAPSDLDAAALRSVGVARVKVMPNAIDTDAYLPGGPEEEAGAIVFTGIFNHLPNVDAAEWICRQIFPSIRRLNTDAHLYLVGKQAEPIMHLQSASVRVTGFVPDPRDYLSRATVVAVPLRYGGGTRLKILEALAMGKAVVSTTKGAEGLAVTHGTDILLADDPEAFAQAILRLLADSSLRTRLGAAGRALVETRYSWRAMELVVRSSILPRAAVPVAAG